MTGRPGAGELRQTRREKDMSAKTSGHRSKVWLATVVLACAVSFGAGDVALAGRATSGAVGTNKNIDRSLDIGIGTHKGIDRALLTSPRQ
jgi:hypothetical protein